MTTSTQCRLVWKDDGGFEVTYLDNQHTVDLKKLSCTCREREISGIPCCHAICAIFHESKSPKDYVSEWYRKEKYMASYKTCSSTYEGKKFWPKGLPPILPPTVKVHTNEDVKRTSQSHEPISIGQTHVTKSTTIPSDSQKTHVHLPTTRSMRIAGNQPNNSSHGQPSNKRKMMTVRYKFSNGCYTPTTTPKKIGASTSQFNHTWKGLGLSWKGNKVVTTRQLQQKLSNASRKHPKS
ncbi:hypothetical protein V6N13_082634 [Hibiscus sabdariffa]